MRNNYFNTIKIKEEDKKNAMITIFQIVNNSANLLSLEEVIQYKKELMSKLTEDEILAMYDLARTVKIERLAFKRNEKLYKYLNKEKILEFIKVAVEDIQDTKRRTPNIKWSLSVNKILSRLERREKESSEEVSIMKRSNKISRTRNIIDNRGYLER